MLQNVQVDAAKMLVKAPTGQVSFLVGTNQSQSQTTTTKKGLLFDAVRTTLETHKTYTQSLINAELEVETGRVVLQEIAGQTTDFLKRLKLNGQAGADSVTKEIMQEEYTMTSQKTRSLSKLAGAVIALSVSLITQGMATPYVSAVWAPAANAAFSGLASKATVSLIANEGRLDKVVAELTSDQGLKALAQSMVTASVPGTGGLGMAGDLASRTATGTLTSIAFGAKGSDAFQSSLRGSLVSSLGAQLSGTIGDLKADETLNVLTHKIAHGLNGALMGAILEGEKGLLPGAVSAIVAESAAESLGGLLSMERTLLVSKLTSAMAGAAVDIAQGGDGTKGLATASTVGAITVENNWAQHREKAAAQEAEEQEKAEAEAFQDQPLTPRSQAYLDAVDYAESLVDRVDAKTALGGKIYRKLLDPKGLGKIAYEGKQEELASQSLAKQMRGETLTPYEAQVLSSWRMNEIILPAATVVGVGMVAKAVSIAARPLASALQAGKAKVGMGSGFVSESGKIASAPTTWTAPGGTQQTYKVWKRTDIDWSQVRTEGVERFVGKTNLEASRAGLAPQLSDGKFATLHHINQNGKGNLVEASTKFHAFGQPGFQPLHSVWGRSKPHPVNPIDRAKFKQDTAEYWKQRGME